jgi:hypothetical protein
MIVNRIPAQKRVGGDMGGPAGMGISGSIKASHIALIIAILSKCFGLGKASVVVDVGCALGR